MLSWQRACGAGERSHTLSRVWGRGGAPAAQTQIIVGVTIPYNAPSFLLLKIRRVTHLPLQPHGSVCAWILRLQSRAHGDTDTTDPGP